MTIRPASKILIFCLSCTLFVSCDRTTKNLAKEHLMNEPPVFYMNETIILHYTENTGAAMSLGSNLPQPYNFLLLSLLPLIFLITLFIYTIRKIEEFKLIKTIALSLIVSGGLGNVIDRIIFDRHVTDFIILQFGNFHTGIFNVADICVTSGVIGLLFFSFRNENKKNITPNADMEPQQ